MNSLDPESFYRFSFLSKLIRFERSAGNHGKTCSATVSNGRLKTACCQNVWLGIVVNPAIKVSNVTIASALKSPKIEPNNRSINPNPMPLIKDVNNMVASAVINNTDRNVKTNAIEIRNVSPAISAGRNRSKNDAYALATMKATTQPAMDNASRTNPRKMLKPIETRKITEKT